MIVKRYFNQWYFNEKKLFKKLNKLDTINFKRELMISILIEDAINNKKFREYILENLKQNGQLNSVILCNGIHPKNKILKKIMSIFDNIFGHEHIFDNVSIDYDKLIEHITMYEFLTAEEEEFLNKIQYFTSTDYIVKEILSRPINDNVTYMDLLDLLMVSSEKFTPIEINIIDKNRVETPKIFLGLTGEQVIKLLIKEPICITSKSNIINKIGLSKEQIENIMNNFEKIKYFYEKEDISVIEFEPYNKLANKFTLNPKLKNKIMNQVPEHFTPLQKAYFIYKLLCQEFVYDEEFFYLQYCVPYKDHLKMSRLSTLTGGEEVICTGFSLIYAKFLELLGLPFSTLGYYNEIIRDLTTDHIKIRFKVDDFIVDADGAIGLFDSDMVSQKIINKTYEFTLVNGTRRMKDILEKQKSEVDDYFENVSDVREYDYAVDMYRQVYFDENKKCCQISFKERIDLVLNIIISSKLKFFDMIILASNLKLKLFSEYLNNVIIEFIINKKSDKDNFIHQLNILFVYNETSDLYDDFNDNKYLVITPDKNIEKLTYQELKKRFFKKQYNFTDNDRVILDLKEGVGINGRRVI